MQMIDTMEGVDLAAVDAVRGFNRFHTRWAGALGGSLHGSGIALTEARVLYELAHRDGPLASELARDLGLDPAHLSRILKHFGGAGWLVRERSSADGRALRLRLTEAGRSVFAGLERTAREQAAQPLARLRPAERERLVAALATAQALLSGTPGSATRPRIREHKPGDLGWIVAAHARLYAEDYGWDGSFEAFVAEIAAQFLRAFQPDRERCFIAELDGSPAGSAVVVQDGEDVAKLRLVIVEKRAQGLGLGKALVGEAIGFARSAGYRRMVLWTNDILHAARGIYVAQGFRLEATERHHSFGQDLIGENWELAL